jgi:hypothetical protein
MANCQIELKTGNGFRVWVSDVRLPVKQSAYSRKVQSAALVPTSRLASRYEKTTTRAQYSFNPVSVYQ